MEEPTQFEMEGIPLPAPDEFTRPSMTTVHEPCTNGPTNSALLATKRTGQPFPTVCVVGVEIAEQPTPVDSLTMDNADDEAGIAIVAATAIHSSALIRI